jgi:ribose transport system substrate-binding protein
MKPISTVLKVLVAGSLGIALAACSEAPGTPTETSPPSATAASLSSASTETSAPSATGCSGRQPGTGLIYYLAPALSDDFQAVVKEQTETIGTELGYTVRTLNANSQATTQVNQFDNAIAQHPRAIIVNAWDASTITTAVEKARAEGIKVFVLDRFVTDTQVDFTSAAGTVRLGQIAAGEVGRLLTEKFGSPTGTVLEIMGDLGDGYTVTVDQGFKEEMGLNYPDVSIITKDSPGWTPEGAAAAIDGQLTASHDIDLIYLHGDFRAATAIAALEGKGVGKGELILVGTDGAAAGLDAIRDGWMTLTVEQPAVQEAAGIWECMADVLAGETLGSGIVDVMGLPSELTLEEWGPTLREPGKVIDRSNVDDPGLWGNLKVATE